METGKIEQAVARLRASRLVCEERERADGRASGLKWALEDADYRTLEIVAENAGRRTSEEPWQDLCSLILRHKRPVPYIEDLQESLFGHPPDYDPTSAWAEGFIEGAKEAWAAVVDELDSTAKSS